MGVQILEAEETDAFRVTDGLLTQAEVEARTAVAGENCFPGVVLACGEEGSGPLKATEMAYPHDLTPLGFA